jgi:hypothetical protein
MVAKLAAGAGPRRPMRRASVVGCRARVTTVSAGRERGENLPPPHRLGGDHWNYVVRSGLISLKGTRRLLAQPPLLRPPALRTSPAVPSGAFLRVGGEILQPWLMSPSTRAAHRLGFDLAPPPVAPGNQTGCVLAHIGMVNGRGRYIGRKGSRLEEGDAPCPTSRPQTPPNCTA